MRVLVLGAGGAASNGFARALKLAGGYTLVGTNSSPTDLLLSECDTNHLIPSVTDWDEWRKAIYKLVLHECPDFIHAQNDAEVEGLGRFRSAIHTMGTKTFLPRTEVILLCRDKWLSYERWRDAGVPVPLTGLPSELDLGHAVLPLGATEVWLRPRTGAGGQKSLRTDDMDLVYGWLDKYDDTEFTIAEALTDQTVTVQQLYWKGQLVCSQQRTRESWANSGSSATGVSGSTGVGVTSSEPEADRVADLAVAAVDDAPHGLYGVDMCRRADGTPCVTEINIGRFFTTVPEFMAQAGFNMADVYAATGWFQQAPVGVERNPLPDGLRWIRSMDRSPVLVAA